VLARRPLERTCVPDVHSDTCPGSMERDVSRGHHIAWSTQLSGHLVPHMQLSCLMQPRIGHHARHQPAGSRARCPRPSFPRKRSRKRYIPAGSIDSPALPRMVRSALVTYGLTSNQDSSTTLEYRPINAADVMAGRALDLRRSWYRTRKPPNASSCPFRSSPSGADATTTRALPASTNGRDPEDPQPESAPPPMP